MAEQKTTRIWWLTDDYGGWQDGQAIAEDKLPMWWDDWGILRDAADVIKMAGDQGYHLAEDEVAVEENLSDFSVMADALLRHLRENTNVFFYSAYYLPQTKEGLEQLSITLDDTEAGECRQVTLLSDMTLAYDIENHPADLDEEGLLIRDWVIRYQDQPHR